MINIANNIPNNFFDNYTVSSKGFYNVPISYDIETSSYYDNDNNKQALTYMHGLMIDNTYIYFRKWAEFKDFINRLKYLIHPHKIIIYVHNLSYEFQFFCKQLKITSVFARKERRPIKCRSGNIEFRCSYFLTNLSLKKLAENNGYSYKEIYDYSKYRDYNTHLSYDEILYNLIDCKIVTQHIKKLLSTYDIDKIPLTSTAFTRQHTLNYLKKDTQNYLAYREKIKKAYPTPEVFKILMKCFAGGYTHANSRYANQILTHVKSYDFTSHYPAVLLRHKYPYKFNPVSVDFNDENYATIGLYQFENIKANSTITYISKHKINNKINAMFDNGRLLCADMIEIYLTDIDLKIINLFYTYESIDCKCKYAAIYKHLPTGLIKSMMTDYRDKTTLKGIAGQEENYLAAKGRLNSFYGMCVTNPLNDDIDFGSDEMWYKKPITDINEILQEKKNNYNTFLLYQWGVYCTAWARYDLLQNVKKLEDKNGINHTVYCDTDSIKFLGEYDYVFDEFNEQIKKENKLAADYFELDYDDYAPKNKRGERFEIGLFDCETAGENNDYKEFKTLGAKRYAYLQKYHYHFTVSGIPKKNILKYLKHLAVKENKHILDLFNNDLEIPAEYTGKLTMTYIDNATNKDEKSTIHAEPAPFCIDMHDYKTYLDLLFRISNKSSQITSLKPLEEIDELIYELERKKFYENK